LCSRTKENRFDYSEVLSDIWGADGGQRSNSVYPGAGGNCSDCVTFIDKVAGALQASRLKFA